jgi:N-hydroxyarylamine O-acetyltransferase
MPIRLDLPSLMDKLVRRKRGGYCFEQNSLFGAALRAVGFEATPFEARVRLGAKSLLPRTHMVLRVEVRGESWLCDVGFGGDGLLEPVPMDGRELAHGYRTYRVVRKELEGEPAPAGSSLALAVLVLQALGMPGTEGWLDLYAVEPRPVYPIDLEVANWYTSTWPESAFVQTRTAQRITPGARFTLRGRTLSIVCGRDGAAPEVEVRELAEHEVEAVLREVMGVA